MSAPRTHLRSIRAATDRLAHSRTWIACCLGRGTRAPLGEGDVEQLVEEFGESQFAGGTLIFGCGDVAARVHVVRTGTIELSREINGRRVALQILQPGDVFGDVPAFLGEPEPFDARAMEDSTVLSLEVTTLFALLQTRPHVARRWFISLAERMAGLHNRLADLLSGGLDSQLSSILLREGAGASEVRLTQDQLAELVGAPRTSVQRVLKALEAAGLIKLRYRRISLLDIDGLRTLVGESRAPTGGPTAP